MRFFIYLFYSLSLYIYFSMFIVALAARNIHLMNYFGVACVLLLETSLP